MGYFLYKLIPPLGLDDPARHLDGARFEVYPMPGAIGAWPRVPA